MERPERELICNRVEGMRARWRWSCGDDGMCHNNSATAAYIELSYTGYVSA